MEAILSSRAAFAVGLQVFQVRIWAIFSLTLTSSLSLVSKTGNYPQYTVASFRRGAARSAGLGGQEQSPRAARALWNVQRAGLPWPSLTLACGQYHRHVGKRHPATPVGDCVHTELHGDSQLVTNSNRIGCSQTATPRQTVTRINTIASWTITSLYAKAFVASVGKCPRQGVAHALNHRGLVLEGFMGM